MACSAGKDGSPLPRRRKRTSRLEARPNTDTRELARAARQVATTRIQRSCRRSAFVKANVELGEKFGDAAKYVWHGIFG